MLVLGGFEKPELQSIAYPPLQQINNLLHPLFYVFVFAVVQIYEFNDHKFILVTPFTQFAGN